MSTGSPNRLRASNDKLDSSVKQLISRIHVQRSAGRMLALVVIAFAFFSILQPKIFLNPVNLQNIAIATPEVALIAVAMMIAMLTGGIDLSLVAIANLTAVTIAMTYNAVAANDPGMEEKMGIPIVLLGLLVGILAGTVNGILIAFLGITPILATLGTMQVFNGLAVVWTGGSTIYGVPSVLTTVGTTTLLGIPLLFIIFIIIAIIVGVILTKTPIGAKIELQGANPTAGMYSGIPPRRILMSSYVMTGTLGAIAGLMFISRNPTASADYGLSYTLLAVSIAVLGGTNIFGGYATVTGVALAAVVLQIVSSGFNAIRLSNYEYSIAQGVILIAVLVIDQVHFKFKRKPKEPKNDVPLPAVIDS